MRAITVLLLLTSLTSLTTAQAQYPSYYPGRGGPSAQPYLAPTPAGPPDSRARAMLEAHNAVRARVGVPPLVWSARVAAVAQDWANRLIATGDFSHRPDNPYGENLFAISGGTASPAEVVSAWAGEAHDYDLRSNTCTAVCGHYTQIVWRATRRVGCAVATDPEHEVWVCDYDPPGNYEGERPY